MTLHRTGVPGRPASLRYVAACAALGLFAIGGCSPSTRSDSPTTKANSEQERTESESVESSPLAAFKGARQAASVYDWKAFCSHLTPRARNILATSLAVAGNRFRKMAAMTEKSGGEKIAGGIRDQAAPIVRVLEQHQIPSDILKDADPKLLAQPEPPPELINEVLKSVKDRDAFVADMMTAFVALQGGRPAVSLSGEIENLQVEGDRATAVLVQSNGKQESRNPIEFRKIDGRWMIEFTMN